MLHPCCFIYCGIQYNILLFLTEQISLLSFYYIQDVYHKKQPRTRLDKRLDTISGRASVASINGAGKSGGALSPSAEVLGTLRKFLGSKEHLDWLKIDLNAAKIIAVLDYKTHKTIKMEVHIYSVKVKQVTYESKI